MNKNIEKFISELSHSNKKSVSRLISIVESSEAENEIILHKLSDKIGNAYRVGITGPPGVGKSTLTLQLTKSLISDGLKVGIIAVDPTSPFSGGALLGDRIRMNEITNNESVFIRSMATRGSMGGLSKKAIDAADILDAAGFDILIFETVGVGQSEIQITEAADTKIVVLVPESGDAIQALKAGLMEIGDIFILNKSDRPGSENAVLALKSMLQLREMTTESWMPKIFKTIAAENIGIEEIKAEIFDHKKFLIDKNQFYNLRREKALKRIKDIIIDKLNKKLWAENVIPEIDNFILPSLENHISPYEISNQILNKIKFSGD